MDSRSEFLTQFLAHEADLKAFIGAVIPDRSARDDVFQEVALALWRSFDRYDRRRKFGAWARGVAVNKVLQEKRRNARFPLAFSPEVVEALADGFERTESSEQSRTEALDACLRKLPERSSTLMRLKYGDALSGADIALRLRMSVDAVYQALSRIRAQLEVCIRRRLDEAGRRV